MTLPDKQCSSSFPLLKTGQRVPDGLLTLSSTVGVNPGIFTLTECAIAEIRGKVVASCHPCSWKPTPTRESTAARSPAIGQAPVGGWLPPSLPRWLVGV